MKRETIPMTAILAVGVLLLLPVLYVLSSGPAYWLYVRGTLSIEAYERFSMPLTTFCTDYDTVSGILDSYGEWWVSFGDWLMPRKTDPCISVIPVVG